MGATTLNAISIVWIGLCLASAAVTWVDILAGHRQKMKIMEWVWPITALYFGPLALFMYWRYARNPRETPFWVSVFQSTCHCGAGCSLGDFVGEWLVYLTGFTLAGSVLWANYLADFLFAYAVGILFQYLSIRAMKDLSPGKALAHAFKADTVSLIAFEVGMFAWMALNRHLTGDQYKPVDLEYWFLMQIAMIVGFLTSIPANWWLVRAGIKPKMGSM